MKYSKFVSMINDKEFQTVSNLDPFERYKYVLKKIADKESFIGVKNTENEWALSDIEGETLFTVWSDSAFANSCLVDNWKNFKLYEGELDELVDEIFPFIDKNKVLIDVFPLPHKTGFIVSLEEFIRDLEEELDKYD
ncbi:hypothetical protein D3C87_228080 [compost metagenome]